MGGARHERQCEERITLASQERIKCAWFWCWWLRSAYGKPRALRWLEALKGFGRARKGIFRFAAVSALVLFFFTSTAYAIEGFNSVIYGPVSYTWQNVTYSQIGVIASNKYNAAAVSLGYNPDDFSADVKAKLSNASTGGTFYTFAQEFVNPDPDGLSVTMQGVSPGFWATCYGLYGEGNVWYAEVTKNSMVSAKEDLEAILNGGNLGGGGGGNEQIAAQYTLDSVDFYGTPNITTIYGSWTIRPKNERDLTFIVNVSSSVMQSASGYLSTHPYICVWSGFPGTVAYLYGDRDYSDYCRFSLSSSPWYINADNTLCTDGDVYTWHDTARVDLDSTVTVTINSSASHTTASTGRTFGRSGRGFAEFEHDTTPPIPDTNWPESDPVDPPQQPEVPEPQEPEIDPQPDAPTPQPSPTFPIYVDVSTTTYTADLQGVLDAMNDHCMHLQNALHTQFSDFWTVLSTKMTNDFATLRQYLHGQFSWLGETVQDEFSETRDYLKELFEWLADQFDYSISGGAYNDNTVVSWLKKIYSKLGTGTSSKPVDPVADPDQTGSWLDTLINNLLTALEDVFPGLIGQVGDFFGGALGNLTQKFPFSIPWDVAAILGMLVAEPVAPSVEIPAYTLTSEGLTQAGSYDIDLSAYDAAWGAVRIMMRIAFALYVCVHTKDFLEVIERVMM